MSKHNTQEKSTEILYAFQLACEHPTSKDIIEWIKRYPQYADDIREHAEMLLAQHSRSQFEQLKPDEEMLAKGRSEAMSAIYEAEQAAAREEDKSVAMSPDEINSSGASGATPGISSKVNFDQLLENANQSIPKLARKIDIERSVIAELAAGRMKLPIGDRLLVAIADVLGHTTNAIVAAIRQSLQQPRLGHAKARDRPVIQARPYEEIVVSSANMTPEQKQYWLDKPSSWTPGAKFD